MLTCHRLDFASLLFSKGMRRTPLAFVLSVLLVGPVACTSQDGEPSSDPAARSGAEESVPWTGASPRIVPDVPNSGVAECENPDLLTGIGHRNAFVAGLVEERELVWSPHVSSGHGRPHVEDVAECPLLMPGLRIVLRGDDGVLRSVTFNERVLGRLHVSVPSALHYGEAIELDPPLDETMWAVEGVFPLGATVAVRAARAEDGTLGGINGPLFGLEEGQIVVGGKFYCEPVREQAESLAEGSWSELLEVLQANVGVDELEAPSHDMYFPGALCHWHASRMSPEDYCALFPRDHDCDDSGVSDGGSEDGDGDGDL